MKKIILPLLCIASILIANNTLAQKKIKAYGFELYSLSDWSVDKDKDYIMLSSPDSNADITIEEHSVTSKDDVLDVIMKFLASNGTLSKGDALQYSKRKEMVKNGVKIFEALCVTPPDEDGDIIWFKVWATANKDKSKVVLFGAYNLIEKGKPKTRHITELDGILDSIRPL